MNDSREVNTLKAELTSVLNSKDAVCDTGASPKVVYRKTDYRKRWNRGFSRHKSDIWSHLIWIRVELKGVAMWMHKASMTIHEALLSSDLWGNAPFVHGTLLQMENYHEQAFAKCTESETDSLGKRIICLPLDLDGLL